MPEPDFSIKAIRERMGWSDDYRCHEKLPSKEADIAHFVRANEALAAALEEGQSFVREYAEVYAADNKLVPLHPTHKALLDRMGHALALHRGEKT